MRGKIKFFQKCIAFRPSVLGMRTRSSEGVFTVFYILFIERKYIS